MEKSNDTFSGLILILILVGLIWVANPKAFDAMGQGQRAPAQNTEQETITTIFGGYAGQALAIANCESSMDPTAINPHSVEGSHATGLFQILVPATWSTTSYAQLDPTDPMINTKAAYQIFQRDGDSWREWACSKILSLSIGGALNVHNSRGIEGFAWGGGKNRA